MEMRLGKEIHPLVLRQVKFSTALVHVKEISEKHPHTFYKIRLASDSDSGNYTGSCSSSTVSSPQLDIRRDHSIFCNEGTRGKTSEPDWGPEISTFSTIKQEREDIGPRHLPPR